jgi:hypothetical protein
MACALICKAFRGMGVEMPGRALRLFGRTTKRSVTLRRADLGEMIRPVNPL